MRTPISSFGSSSAGAWVRHLSHFTVVEEGLAPSGPPDTSRTYTTFLSTSCSRPWSLIAPYCDTTDRWKSRQWIAGTKASGASRLRRRNRLRIHDGGAVGSPEASATRKWRSRISRSITCEQRIAVAGPARRGSIRRYRPQRAGQPVIQFSGKLPFKVTTPAICCPLPALRRIAERYQNPDARRTGQGQPETHEATKAAQSP